MCIRNKFEDSNRKRMYVHMYVYKILARKVCCTYVYVLGMEVSRRNICTYVCIHAGMVDSHRHTYARTYVCIQGVEGSPRKFMCIHM